MKPRKSTILIALTFAALMGPALPPADAMIPGDGGNTGPEPVPHVLFASAKANSTSLKRVHAEHKAARAAAVATGFTHKQPLP